MRSEKCNIQKLIKIGYPEYPSIDGYTTPGLPLLECSIAYLKLKYSAGEFDEIEQTLGLQTSPFMTQHSQLVRIQRTIKSK
jgi:hypothetical protein